MIILKLPGFADLIAQLAAGNFPACAQLPVFRFLKCSLLSQLAPDFCSDLSLFSPSYICPWPCCTNCFPLCHAEFKSASENFEPGQSPLGGGHKSHRACVLGWPKVCLLFRRFRGFKNHFENTQFRFSLLNSEALINKC